MRGAGGVNDIFYYSYVNLPLQLSVCQSIRFLCPLFIAITKMDKLGACVCVCILVINSAPNLPLKRPTQGAGSEIGIVDFPGNVMTGEDINSSTK